MGLNGTTNLFVYDMVEKWRALTSLPAVLAVWAGRPEVITQEVVRDFQESLAYGLQKLDEISAEASVEMKLPAAELRRYLAENIDYRLDAENLQGLETVLRTGGGSWDFGCAREMVMAEEAVEWSGRPNFGRRNRVSRTEEGQTVGITKQEALEMLRSDDLVGIGMAAHQLRLKKNDPRVVTYQIDRNINYTNFCTEYCSFCAFYRPLGAKDGYILSFEAIYEKIEEMLQLGGTGVLLQGGLHPDLQIGYYENLLRSLKAGIRKCICTAFPRRKFCASRK